MAACKRLVVNLSEVLCNRVKGYELIKAYNEMAELNVELSEIGFISDMKELVEYEAKLSESDLPNDHNGEKRRYILC